MQFLKVRAKNFLSYGENFIEFNMNKHLTTMLVGENGMGKSTIIDAITFALYGKSFRDIKKDLLINNVNKKGAVVELELIGINGKNVLIRRGLKPHFFEIYEDSKLVDQHAEVKDYQEHLEKNIIGMNFITYSQTVIISKTRYVPFMKLRAGERRLFVESILNIEIFGDMLKIQNKKMSLLKEEESELKTSLKIIDSSLLSKIENLKRFNALVAKSKLDSENENKEEINLLNQKIIEGNNKSEKLKSFIDDTDYSVDLEKYNKLNKFLLLTESKIQTLETDALKLKNTPDKCYVCGSNMDVSHVQLHINDIEHNLSNTRINLDKINSEIQRLQPTYDLYIKQHEKNVRINSEIKNITSNILEYRSNIDRLLNKKIDTSKYDADISNLKDEIRLLKSSLDLTNTNLSKKLKEINTNAFVLSLLKDSGIKSAIIQNSIPIINKTINEYLHKFGFFITFELDSEFNETIYIRGINTMVYSSFSEGEKLRIDLALILAWRELSLMQSGLSCNLLFFDEMTDSSMDGDGVELFMRAINSLINTNTWIITHTPEKLENYVRGFIEIGKNDGFSIIK